MMRICKVLGCVLILSLAARASESDQEERMRKLEDMVQRQQEQLQSMQQKLGEKDRDLVEAEKRIKALETMQTTTDQSIERILERKTYFAPSAAEGKSDNTFKVFWKEGLRLETADKQFKLAIGGRVQYDYVFPWEDARISDSLGEQEVFTEFRRARLGVSGTLYNNFIFKGEYDFSDDGDGSTEFKDVYMGLTNLPGIGTAKFGNQFEPFSLEEQTSSKYTTFMERGAIENVFTPGRNPGMRLENSHLDDRLYWALGVFRLGNVDGESSKDDDADVIVADDDGNFRPSDGQANWRFDGRIVGLPWWEEDGQKMVHLGLAYMYHMHPSRTLRHRARPEVHTFTQVLDTGTFTADDSHIFGAELAMVYDSWSLQAEYMARWDNRDIGLFTDDPGAPPTINDDRSDDPFFHGFYVFGSYFLTGEHRRYKKGGGVFDRVKPKRNFWAGNDEIGLGAWELALRYTWIDLDSDGPDDNGGTETSRIRGGKLQNITAAANWYLNPNAKVMFNYVFTDVEDGDRNTTVVDGVEGPNRANGQAHTFMMRFAMDF